MSKTLQGHRTKLDNNKQKGQNRRQSVVTGRQHCYTVQYNHDRLVIVINVVIYCTPLSYHHITITRPP